MYQQPIPTIKEIAEIYPMYLLERASITTPVARVMPVYMKEIAEMTIHVFIEKVENALESKNPKYAAFYLGMATWQAIQINKLETFGEKLEELRKKIEST